MDPSKSRLTEEERLIERLHEVFGDLPYPGDDNLAVDCGPDRGYIEDILRGKKWTELTAAEMVKIKDYQAFLTRDALRYYMPAYIKCGFDDGEDAEEVAFFVHILFLRPAEDDYWREKFTVFTDRELKLLREYAEFCRSRDADFPEPWDRAFEGYWGKV